MRKEPSKSAENSPSASPCDQEKEPLLVEVDCQQDQLLQDSDEVQKVPIGSYIISLVCMALFLYTLHLNHWTLEKFNMNPMLGPSIEVLNRAGAKNTERIINFHEWYRWIAPTFLHAGFLHLIFNYVGLVNVGSQIEHEFGAVACIAVFVVSGISGNLLSAIYLPNVLSVGASGGILGLMASALIDLLLNWKKILKPCTHFIHVLFFLALLLTLGLLPIIDNFMHIGGIIGGLLVAGCIYPFRSFKNWYLKLLVASVSFLLLIGWFAFLFQTLYHDTKLYSYCNSCMKLDCIETKFWSCSIGQCVFQRDDGSSIAQPLSFCGF